jgi:hypothetical protein
MRIGKKLLTPNSATITHQQGVSTQNLTITVGIVVGI